MGVRDGIRLGGAWRGPARRRRAGALAAAALTALSAFGAAADQRARDQAAFRAELERPGPQWVVVSRHFRHTERCGGDGCVLMGPTDDDAACEAWARAYNDGGDVNDHARCVSADAFKTVDR